MKKEITAKAAIEIIGVLRSNNIKTKLIYRKYGKYAILKVYAGAESIIYTKLYKSEWLIKKISGMDYTYIHKVVK